MSRHVYFSWVVTSICLIRLENLTRDWTFLLLGLATVRVLWTRKCLKELCHSADGFKQCWGHMIVSHNLGLEERDLPRSTRRTFPCKIVNCRLCLITQLKTMSFYCTASSYTNLCNTTHFWIAEIKQMQKSHSFIFVHQLKYLWRMCQCCEASCETLQ
jgi:hypothetical protein